MTFLLWFLAGAVVGFFIVAWVVRGAAACGVGRGLGW